MTFSLTYYGKLYWQFFLYSLKRELEFKANFIATVLVNLIWNCTQLLFFEILYAHTDSIGSFSRSDMLVFLATVFIVDSSWEVFFNLNTSKINSYVSNGDLDFLIIKPIPSQFFVSCRYINIGAGINFIASVGLLCYVLTHYHIAITPGRTALYALLCVNGMLTVYILDFCTSVLVLWFRKFSFARWLWFEILKFGYKPDVIYPHLMRKTFFVLPPLMVIATVPTRVLIKDFPIIYAFAYFGLTVIFLFLSQKLWRVALRQYESASS